MAVKEDRDYYIKQYMEEDEDLKKFVRSYWILMKRGKDVKTPKLFLLSSAHILINLGGISHFRTPGREAQCRGNQVFHASTQVWDVHYARDTHIVGIELSPMGYYFLTGNDPAEKIDVIEQLNESDPELEVFIEENKGELEGEMLSGMRSYLSRRLEPHYGSEEMAVIYDVIQRIDRGEKISELPEEYGLSIRTLERRFRRYTGFTLKKYQLIVRMNKLLEDVYMNEDIRWGDLAVKHGFFDQAHMIKVLKKYLGKTPGEYLEVRDLLGDLFIVE